MNRDTFCEWADLLTEKQAEAWYLRRVDGVGRQKAAVEMETSPSNVDNLERAAHHKIIRAHNLVNIVDATGVEPDEGVIGVCAVSDEPQTALAPHPDDADLPLEDQRMVAESVAEEIRDQQSAGESE